MSKLRSIIAGHRGLLLALIVVAVGLAVSNWARWPRPRLSWTQPRLNSGSENIAVSPDGRRVLMIGLLKAWVRDLDSGRTFELSLSEAGDGSEVYPGWIRFLSDGRTVAATWGSTGLVRAWDVDSGRKLFEHPALPKGFWAFQKFAENGSAVAIMTFGQNREPRPSITVWGRSWAGPRTFTGSRPVAFSPNGRYLISGDDAYPEPSFVVREAETGRVVGSVPARSTAGWFAVGVSNDGKTTVDARPSGTTVRDVLTGSKRATLATRPQLEESEFETIATIRDEGRSLTIEETHRDGILFESWDLAANPPRQVFAGKVKAASPDRRRIVRLDPATGEAEIVELASMKVVADLDANADSFEFSRDGRVLAMKIIQSTSSDHHPLLSRLPLRFRPRWFDRTMTEVRLLDASNGRGLASVSVPEILDEGIDVVLAPDGESLILRTFVPIDGSNQLAKFDLHDIRPKPVVWPIEASLSGLAIAGGIWVGYPATAVDQS